ncbi:MAG: glutamate--tRNA ligase [Candidatus Aenigmarchaeota archaeon]|nr:glutamate--tRNA ligase [Candidatus Aenigmarchaeota archaeon]
MDVSKVVKRYILDNAISHNGKAIAKSVLGKILADYPELRSMVLQLKHEIEIQIGTINKMPLKKQKKELEKLGIVKKKEKEFRKHDLAELIGARTGHFVVRFAPNPNGALTLGHARPAILNYEYAKKYKGKMILRFDDTDPKHKVPEKKFYTWIKEDLKWLGIKWDKVVVASKRLNIYYNYAKKLIEMGKAYVCTCGEEWKTFRNKSEACPCRSLPKREQLKRWKKMLAKNGYKEHEAVLRIKTDLNATNPALRDWPAFRIVDKPNHPLKKAKVWPLLDFQSAIDDHLFGVTHILRGIDLQTSEKRQKYIYQYFKWDYPITITVGKFYLSGVVLSKSEIKKGIKEGKFRGWDDTKLGTIRSLRRRGFQPEAIRKLIVEIGAKSADITISFENLAAYNRKLIDPEANRYFFVPNPMRIEIENPPVKTKKIPLHPMKNRGFRTFKITKTLYIDKKDYEKYKGLEVRLKDLFNIKLGKKIKVTGKEVKSIPKIQWVTRNHIEVRVLMEDKMVKGYGEQNLKNVKPGTIVQFERFGFVRIEKNDKKSIVAVFAHK